MMTVVVGDGGRRWWSSAMEVVVGAGLICHATPLFFSPPELISASCTGLLVNKIFADFKKYAMPHGCCSEKMKA
jgi:hypothetical protein